MSYSQKQVIISLIEKKGKVWLTFRKLVTNFSVLLSSMQKLCKKLKQAQSIFFLSNIIHHNKTGFVEGRETVRSIFYVMELTLKNEKNKTKQKKPLRCKHGII